MSVPSATEPWTDEREATHFLNYPGDLRGSFSTYRPLDGNGPLLWPVEAAYDDETKKTRVGFSLISPAGVCRRCYCTDDRACAGGCSWVEPNLCSRCAA